MLLTSCKVEIFLCLMLVVKVSSLEGRFVDIKSNILGPPIPNRPFVIAWDVASEMCQEDFGIDLDLKDFDIVYNANKGWQGDNLVIFYGRHIGLYPSFDKDGKPINGGLPQLGNITGHMTKAATDITTGIPDKNFQGLAVVDWERWHAVFDRSASNIYHKKSIEKVKEEHPDWTHAEQVALARFEYNTAARYFIESTVQLGKLLRPKALWGYYLYPNCFNYDKTGKNLKCSETTLKLNNDIQWLFDDSTALYPSVYLGEWFSNKTYAIDYVKNRIVEARRVDNSRAGHTSIPIFPYHMISYKKEAKLLNLLDLKHSIGVAALLGTSGMVIWGGYNVAKTAESCKTLQKYVNTTLGPFCKKTSDAATICSAKYCSSHGRCVVSPIVLSNNSKRRYLTTAEASDILGYLGDSTYKIYDKAMGNSKFFRDYTVTCQCYAGWQGKNCMIPEI